MYLVLLSFTVVLRERRAQLMVFFSPEFHDDEEEALAEKRSREREEEEERALFCGVKWGFDGSAKGRERERERGTSMALVLLQ